MQDRRISHSWLLGVVMPLWEAAQLQYASKQEWKRRWRTGNKNPHSVLFITKYIIMQSHELEIYIFEERQKNVSECSFAIYRFDIPFFLWKDREKVRQSTKSRGLQATQRQFLMGKSWGINKFNGVWISIIPLRIAIRGCKWQDPAAQHLCR